jgi:hypothetical protein
VISQLDHRYAAEVEDVITSPPQQDPYTKLRTELLKRLSLSREQRAQQLLKFEEMGDRKPSQFLRHLRGLAPDVPDYLLRTIWTNRLPTKVRTTLACHPEIQLDAAALCADRITETVLPPALARIDQSTDTTELLRRIEELSRRVETLSTERNRPRSRDRSSSSRDREYSPRDHPSNPRIRRPYNRSPSRHDAPTNFCWYHRRFGARAQKCTPPCAHQQQGKLTQQTAPAAHVCTIATGRLFVTDKSSKQRFLIDTGSDFCVFPRKLIPQRRERVNYDLCAANGTTIPTYGWLPLSLNLGLRREFVWRFVMADVAQPLIGADFLSHFGILVDCRNNRLLDGVTSLSAPAQAVSSLIPSVKVISGGTSAYTLLSEFPDLTRPTGIQRETRHITVVFQTLHCITQRPPSHL